MKETLEIIITQYIAGLMKENLIKHSYDEPIVVSFGKDLPYEFQCAS